MNTHTIVVDIHQNMLRTREDIDQLVSETRVLHLQRTHTDDRIASGYVSDLSHYGPSVSRLHLAHLGNHHPHHQGSSLDATS